ncbi:MAG: PAS domain S-box protein [Actinomycetota bacterium]
MGEIQAGMAAGLAPANLEAELAASSAEQPSEAQPPTGRPYGPEPADDQPTLVQPAVVQPVADQPHPAEPYAGPPPVAPPPVHQPPTAQPPGRAAQAPGHQPPVHQRSAQLPPAYQTSVYESPVPQGSLQPPASPPSTPAAELLEFAVGQVLRDDIAIDALPVILSRLAGMFGCRAALAFQEDADGEMIVLAAYPRQAGADKALRAAFSRLSMTYRDMTREHGYFQAPLAPAITWSPASASTSPVTVMMATSPGADGRCLCAIALIGDSRGWDASCRATTRALAAIVAAQIRHTNDTTDLAERQARTDALIEASPDAIVVGDADRRLTVFNKAAEDLTGWNRDEVLGQDTLEVLIPAYSRASFAASTAEYLEHSAQGKNVPRVRLPILRADGSERLVEMAPVPMVIDGRAIFCSFLRDIGELDRAHNELRETEERFRLMSQLAPVGIMQSDIMGSCIFANDRWCELMGVTPEQALGTPWSYGIEPDDINRIEREWEQAARHDGELRTDCRLKPIGGAETWVHVAVIPVVGADGRAVGFLSAITNVSERKRAETERERLLTAEREARRKLADQTERLNGLVDSAIPGILFDDEHGNIIQVNQSFCDLFGLPGKPKELVGTPSWKIGVRIRKAFADPGGFMELTRKLVTEQDPVPLDEITCADGRTLEWDFAPVFVGGEYRGNLWGVGDVTGRHELQEQRERLLEAELSAREAAERAQLRLTEQNNRLQELDEAKTEFLATMSHELRTPLTSIVSFTDLILDDQGSLPPDTVSSLAVIQRNGERLLRLLGDLLLLSRLEARAIPVDFMPVSIPDLITDAVRSISATAAERGVTVMSSSADGPPVAGDHLRLQQVMDNLLSNAIKFSGRGGQVRIEATHDGQMWRIDVADDGIGIPADELDQLFGRFVRATNARMAGLPGTGLGLSVVKGISELHGGRVEVRSVVELGTTFSVYLPVQA